MSRHSDLAKTKKKRGPVTGRSRRAPSPNFFSEYLKRRPERDPTVLLPRSALALARGGFLLYGVLARGWPLGWLAAFLFAEFFVVVRLTALGDRWAGGPSLDPERRKTLFGDLAWTVAAVAFFYVCGAHLDAATGALGLAHEAPAQGAGPWPRLADLTERPSWAVLAYLASFFVEFGAELAHSRAARVSYVASSAIIAALFVTVVALGSIFIPFLAAFATPIFGDGSLRGAFAVLLVVARSGAEVAVVWFPYWGHLLADTQPAPPPP